MALVVEDGSGLNNAQSYASVDEAKAYAAARGKTGSIPSKNEDIEALLVQATDFVDTYADKFSGLRVSSSQALEWPRYGATSGDYLVSSDEIPSSLVNAVCQLVIDAKTGKQDLMPNGEGREVIRMKVEGAIEFQYAERGAKGVQPQFYKAMSYLKPLFKRSANRLKVYRG